MRRSFLLFSAALLLAVSPLAWAGEDGDSDRDNSDRPAEVRPDDSDDDAEAPTQPGSTAPAKPSGSSNARPSSPPASRPSSPRTENSNDDEEDYRPTGRSSQVQTSRDQTATSSDDDEIDAERGTRQPRQENPAQPPRMGRGNDNSRRPPSNPNPPNGSYGSRPRSRPGHDRPRDFTHRPRERWRYERYHHYGHWRFLWFWGPVVYAPPVVVYPRVRAPRSRIGVYVRHTGEDEVGQDFAREVRGQLRDVGLRQVYSPAEARLELFIVTMDENPEDPGYGSAVSVSYIWNPGHRFITAQMLDVGGYEVEDLAQLVVDYSAELIDDYR